MVKKKKSVKKAVKKKPSRVSGCPMCASMDQRVKNMTSCDVSMIKLSSMAFILFLITVWPAAMNFVQNVHWGWWLLLTVLFALRPIIRAFK